MSDYNSPANDTLCFRLAESRREVQRAHKENKSLRARVAELESDARRFVWYFCSCKNSDFITACLNGALGGYTLDQWRELIDKAMSSERPVPEDKPTTHLEEGML